MFNLERYSKQKVYWDVLQKTIQYICHNDEDSGNNSPEFRAIRTKIFSHLGNYLVDQIKDDPIGFAQYQTTVMSFLLYPLEYDRLLIIDYIEDLWVKIYEPIVKQQGKSCDFTNSFCEMIKAMTIAKHAYNLAQVAKFICHIMRSLSEEFELASPPVKVLELFKDVIRKGLAYQTNLDRIEAMVHCFREVLEKLKFNHVLILILPIRNVINELVTNRSGLAMVEVKKLLKVLINKIVSPEMLKELTQQPNEVKWNCKMLLKTLSELPDNEKRAWRVLDMKKCMNICDGKSVDLKPASRKATDEFVKIDTVWQFKPETLTEHQRERMLEKRTDIPALYNDMSQSQDSFVIKPWTPSKSVASLKEDKNTVSGPAPPIEGTPSQNDDNSNIVVKEMSSESVTMECEVNRSLTENVTETKAKAIRSDKENNNGNVLSAQMSMSVEQAEHADSEEDVKQKRKKQRTILDNLRIDTVEGKSLDVLNLSRTRRSETLETRTTRRKSVPNKKIGSETKAKTAATMKREDKSVSASKVIPSKALDQKGRRSSRKLLNFGTAENNTQAPTVNYQSEANISDDIIESSQATDVSESSSRRLTISKSRVETGNIITSLEIESDVSSIEEKRAQDKTAEPQQTLDSLKVAETDNSAADKVKDGQSKENMSSEACRITEGNTIADADGTSGTHSTKKNVPSPVSISSPSEPKAVDLKRNLNVLSSPSRRSARLSVDDRDKAIIKMSSPTKKKLVEEKSLINLLGSPIKLDILNKGTPTKRFITTTDSAVFNVACSVKNHDGEGDARFCPLVLLEPIKDITKTLQDVETISHPVSKVMVVKENDETLSTDIATQQPCTSTKTTLSNDDSSMKTVEDKAVKKLSVQEPAQVDALKESSESDANQLSPVKNLDEEMEPLDKSLNRSIVSSPDRAGEAERNADLLNNTLNISPIAEEKHSAGKNLDSGELAGSADRRLSNRIMVRERDTNSVSLPASIMSRRPKASPTPQTPSGSNSGLKNRTPHQQPTVPRSPSSSVIGMSGRGAQLLNLIRKQQSEQQSPKPNTPPQNASTPKSVGQSSATANRLSMRKKAIAGSVAAATTEAGITCEQIDETEEPCPESNTQYLVFSKVLPSPQASPAGSILKRRHNGDDSGDDVESPAHKRKRVSFHDPPVSVTKEYIRQVEECRPVSVSRSLQLSSSIISSADKAKFMMRRKSKSDSISELQDFTNKQDESLKGDEPSHLMKGSTQKLVRTEDDEEEITSSPELLDENDFMMHDATDTMAALQVTSDCMNIDKDESDVIAKSTALDRGKDDTKTEKEGLSTATSEQFKEISFSSEEALFEHVMNRYTLDDILERYISEGKSLEKVKSVRSLTKELSIKMTNDPKTRDVVLDELSERHCVEFLDHAIQENSSEKVCERLSMVTMIDHVFKQLHSTSDGGTMSNNAPADDKNETMLALERIYENLLTLPSTGMSDEKLVNLRDQFLRQEFGRKSRLEIMSLLEDYFKTPSSTT
uniref:Telomere-associated protein Rif1 N-terminal domain-containing protein n=1 Tax=Anopheles farauti TaxID=69004 RepID=A0A182QUA1_9DIPT